MIIALKTDSTPFTAMPNNLNGSRISQITGYSSRTIIANGQQRTKSINQSRILIKKYLL